MTLAERIVPPWLRAGYDHASGDDDPNDGEHRTFFQVLPTARIYSQFPFYNLMNDEDLFVQILATPWSRVNVRADYHWLRLTESHDLWYSGGGATNAHVFGFSGIPAGGNRDLAHVVDMAGNDVAAELIAHLEGTFEIDPRADRPLAERRAGERLGRGIDGEKAAAVFEPPSFDRREAAAGTGDRGARRDRGRIIGGRYGQARVAKLVDGDDLADIGDNAGEHYARS